jgi:hypothetical protein
VSAATFERGLSTPRVCSVTFSLVYVSRAAVPVTRQVVIDLIETSRPANAAAGITGLLLYRDGGFLQMLEGDRDAVESLYASIERDERHCDVTLVRTREEQRRQFPDWSMAYGTVDDDALGVAPDAVDPGPVSADAAFVRELLDIVDPERRT